MIMVLPKRSAYFSLAKFTMLSSVVIFAGCQRIPDQQRVTKLSVADIVKNVRCEIQEALAGEDVDGRKLYPDKIMRKDGVVTENWIYKAAVTYGFEFETKINNNLDLSFNGIWNIPRRIGRRANEKLTSNNSADFDKTREGENLWAASESLGDLKNADCSIVNYKRSFRYPIKGKLNLYKILDDYYEIGNNQFLITTNYQRLVRFTVLKGGTINPIYFISPVPLDRRTFTSSLSWRADRQDIHQVTIAFALDAEFQHLANRVKKKDPPEKEVTLVRIVGGKDGKETIASQIEVIGQVKVIGTGRGAVDGTAPRGALEVFPRGADPKTSRVPYVPPATKRQPSDSRGLSPDVIRRLEEKQYQNRSIRADDSSIR